MITLHVSQERTDLDVEVEQRLIDLVLAHSVEVSEEDSVPCGLPALRDGDQWIPAGDLRGHMVELSKVAATWRKFQSDACYLDDDGSIC